MNRHSLGNVFLSESVEICPDGVECKLPSAIEVSCRDLFIDFFENIGRDAELDRMGICHAKYNRLLDNYSIVTCKLLASNFIYRGN